MVSAIQLPSNPSVLEHSPVLQRTQEKRKNTITELISTEKQYLADLKVIDEIFLTPLQSSRINQSKIIDEIAIRTIFINLPDLIAFSLDFIARLDKGTDFLGGIVLDVLPHMERVFLEYCKFHEEGGNNVEELLTQNEEFRQFITLATVLLPGKTTSWDLPSLLIKPIQRLLKYPLLLGQIEDLTDTDHPDNCNLREAKGKLLALTYKINCVKMRKDIVRKAVDPKSFTEINLVHGVTKKFTRTQMQLKELVGLTPPSSSALLDPLQRRFEATRSHLDRLEGSWYEWRKSVENICWSIEAFAVTWEEVYALPGGELKGRGDWWEGLKLFRVKANLWCADLNKEVVRVSIFHTSVRRSIKTGGRTLNS